MIRPYRDSDFSDVKYLNDISYTKPCSDEELRERLMLNRAWVYDPDPAVQGIVGCLISDEYYENDYVWSITVAPAWRRQGIATALLREAEKEIGGHLKLYTEPNSPGNHLYTKLGYTAGKIERDYYGPGQDAVLMRKL